MLDFNLDDVLSAWGDNHAILLKSVMSDRWGRFGIYSFLLLAFITVYCRYQPYIRPHKIWLNFSGCGCGPCAVRRVIPADSPMARRRRKEESEMKTEKKNRKEIKSVGNGSCN